ncbi:hypothetical protein EYR27_17135 [Xanthomonas oryzae]|nr:hypothetical protein EYR27_17135 [Xanthomonas oryzae]
MSHLLRPVTACRRYRPPLLPLSAVPPAGTPLVPSAPAAQKPLSGVAIGLIGAVTVTRGTNACAHGRPISVQG